MREPDPATTRRRIAAARGVPVEGFLASPEGHADSGGAAELLALWDRIAAGVDRARLLAFARALAAGGSATEPP